MCSGPLFPSLLTVRLKYKKLETEFCTVTWPFFLLLLQFFEYVGYRTVPVSVCCIIISQLLKQFFYLFRKTESQTSVAKPSKNTEVKVGKKIAVEIVWFVKFYVSLLTF